MKEGNFGKYALKRNITLKIFKNNEEKLDCDIYLRCQCSIVPFILFSLSSLINNTIFEMIRMIWYVAVGTYCSSQIFAHLD